MPSKKQLNSMSEPKQIWGEVGRRSGQDYKHRQMMVTTDGGREESGYKGKAGDCVCRAICAVTGLPYQEVYDKLANGNYTQRKSKRQAGGKFGNKGQHTAARGIYTKRKWFKDYMAELGFEWVPTMQIGSGCKVHLRGDELPAGKLVVAVSKHYTAVIDGVIYDNHDSSRRGTRCVYGFWKYTK